MSVSPDQSAPSAKASEFLSDAASFLESRDLTRAIERADIAERLGHDPNECASLRWQCWMLLGEFENAWKESDSISNSREYDPNRFWNGTSWSNGRVMLRCLHGLGDTIQFIRYAPLLRKTCSSLTVQTHPELVRLLEGVSGIDRVISWGPSFPEDHSVWDIQLEVTELPYAFRTAIPSIPASVPYISIPESKRAWAAERLGKRAGLRVALVWESGPYNPDRSIPQALLSPLLQATNCQFYCLHKTQTAVSLAHYPTLQNVVANLAEVLDTASLLMQMDLVITVDTMVAHLAGALNVPVWIMLPAAADWRWMIRRDDSPWYPSARLFRQKRPGDWISLIQELQPDLLSCLASK